MISTCLTPAILKKIKPNEEGDKTSTTMTSHALRSSQLEENAMTHANQSVASLHGLRQSKNTAVLIRIFTNQLDGYNSSTDTSCENSSCPTLEIPIGWNEATTSIQEKKVFPLPAWIYCTRYSDRPSAGKGML